jgi:hypothetical protein
MPDFTRFLGIGTNVRRNTFHGSEATLCILDHARNGRRGYDVVVEVLSNWHLTKKNVLIIVESETVTAEILQKASIFGINGRVWKLQPVEDSIDDPTYPTMRQWLFQVKSSGEPFSK